jgi:hypothetical protein
MCDQANWNRRRGWQAAVLYGSEMFGLIEVVKGKVETVSPKEGATPEWITFSTGTLLRWRIPLVTPLKDIKNLRVTVQQRDNPDHLGYYKLNTKPELIMATPIFTSLYRNPPSNDWIIWEVILDAERIASVTTGKIASIPGSIGKK